MICYELNIAWTQQNWQCYIFFLINNKDLPGLNLNTKMLI